MLSLFKSYQREILGGILGALVTGVVSLSVGIYNLNKTFELTDRKERRNEVSEILYMLRKVEKELDYNLFLLLTGNMVPKVIFKIMPYPLLNMKDPELKKIAEMASGFFEGYLVVEETPPPPSYFRAAMWYHSRTSYIDFDLSEAINELYIKLRRVNENISEVHSELRYNISYIPPQKASYINERVRQAETDIKSISKDEILAIKNKVSEAVRRLDRKSEQLQ
jgi:hypothetical protein